MSVTRQEMAPELGRPPLLKRLAAFDWIWAALLILGAAYAHRRYAALMDVYEVGILYGSAAALAALGWSWKPVRALGIAVAALSLFAVWRYGGDLGRGESDFFLKFLLSGQSATMWMSALFVGATFTYFLALVLRSEFTGKVAGALTWSAAAMGLVGLLVRWRESYLISPDVGHIPVSNLYEVFILFAIVTALLYLYYEGRYRTRALGGFVLLVISASVAFLLWYHFTRDAGEIQPLIPALQSYWMKIHVPANFVGYGAFAIAAMVGIASLLQHYHRHPSRALAVLVPAALFALFGGWTLAKGYNAAGAVDGALLARAAAVGLAWTAGLSLLGWIGLTRRAQGAFPPPELLDDFMYKAIALGFAFFTIATVLGAMWAAEAWGGYWSWDPKETWALIVWLNYAAWLHMRLTKGWRGVPMAWWAVGGLLVTLFAFLGVNMFLSGLHSYGEL